jgi:hypothetical protein
MVTNFEPIDHIAEIRLLIAQEAGCSSGRIYVDAILTKMAILNNLLYAVGLETKAIEVAPNGKWKMTYGGKAAIQSLSTFRYAIAAIIRNIKDCWESANHHRQSVLKDLRFFEKLRVLTMNAEREKPIPSWKKVNGEIDTTYRSPDKQFTDFNIIAALEAYQALEQLLNQHLDNKFPRRRHKQFKMPDHAGMLARLIYRAVIGIKYRAFSSLPDSLGDVGTKELEARQIYALKNAIDQATEQIEEQERIGGATAERTILELKRMRDRAQKSLNQIRHICEFAGSSFPGIEDWAPDEPPKKIITVGTERHVSTF